MSPAPGLEQGPRGDGPGGHRFGGGVVHRRRAPPLVLIVLPAPVLRTNDALLSRQLGRNTQRFAREIGLMDTPEVRHPYLRQLLAVIEEARPEWAEAEHRADLFRHLVGRLCGAAVTDDEIDAAVRARDAERALASADLDSGDVDSETPSPGLESAPSSDVAPSTEARTPAAVEPAAEVEAQDAAANGALDDEARAAAASEDAGA